MAASTAIRNAATTVALLATVGLLGVKMRSLTGAHRSPLASATERDVPLRIGARDLIKNTALVAGDRSARWKVVEFLDYECPPCRAAFPGLVKYVDAQPGTVTLYVRNDPLNIHLHARDAAKLGLAASRSGRFASFDRAIMTGPADFSPDALRKVARRSGLDYDQLQRLAAGNSVKSELEEDIRLSNTLGLEGTPSFILIKPDGTCLRLGSLSNLFGYLPETFSRS